MDISRLTACVAFLATAGAASAQNDWGFISTTGDPDPITVFDLENPGASNTPFGNVATNFNRGMDFDTVDSFYYFVSTDALNDPGDRGLWYFSEGTNTQLTTIPFSDSGDGDATLSADGSTFFVTASDGDATSGDSLFAFTNLNGSPAFTEIGETGLEQIIGLAVNPVTGIMYGYDSGTEALYTIDPEDGTPTLVGTSGLSLAAIGGMDFSADGSTLLLSSGRNLFTVDPANGALTAAGDALLNISALSYRAPIPAPASATLLAIGGLVGIRRRR